MKITRIYIQGCTWCNAKGFVTNPHPAVTNTTITCPVCQGAKTIMVTEVTETRAQRVEKKDFQFTELEPVKK